MTVEELLLGGLHRWQGYAPAQDDELYQLQDAMPAALPTPYVELQRISGGGYGYFRGELPFLRIWSPRALMHHPFRDEIRRHLPGFLAFGDDGHSRLIGFDTREGRPYRICSTHSLAHRGWDSVCAAATDFRTLLHRLLRKVSRSEAVSEPAVAWPAGEATRGGTLAEELERTLHREMSLPKVFAELFRWIEKRGLLRKDRLGRHFGTLVPADDIGAMATSSSSDVAFFAAGATETQSWMGGDQRSLNRLRAFARLDAEGSLAAFWLDPQGAQRIVLMGCDGEARLLADNGEDFLRLLAIGYPRLGNTAQMAQPPLNNKRNEPFRRWLRRERGCTIPSTGAEILPSPVGRLTADPFARWVEQHAR